MTDCLFSQTFVMYSISGPVPSGEGHNNHHVLAYLQLSLCDSHRPYTSHRGWLPVIVKVTTRVGSLRAPVDDKLRMRNL